MIFRKKYTKVVKKKLFKDKDFYWCIKQLKNAIFIPLSIATKRCFISPILYSLIVTYRCNMRCIFCKLPNRVNSENEFSQEKFKKVISSFASLRGIGVGFTGGEPLLREDIFSLIRYAKDKKLITQLTTNGLLLSEETSKKLIDSKLDELSISLDSQISEIQDEIRGLKGAWQETIKGIEDFIKVKERTKSSIVLTISTVINSKNIGHIEEFVEFCKGMGIENISFGMVQEEFIRDGLTAGGQKKVSEVIGFLIKCAKKEYMIDNSIGYLQELSGAFNRRKPCWAGYHSIYVDCYGNIFPCFYYMAKNLAVGNIADIAIEKIWQNIDYNKLRRELLSCHKCNFVCQHELNAFFNLWNHTFI